MAPTTTNTTATNYDDALMEQVATLQRSMDRLVETREEDRKKMVKDISERIIAHLDHNNNNNNEDRAGSSIGGGNKNNNNNNISVKHKQPSNKGLASTGSVVDPSHYPSSGPTRILSSVEEANTTAANNPPQAAKESSSPTRSTNESS
mmetsp:Transcript_5346/g.7466  ORF Transcript_5346/g.7466 Transcript_5346/m.7466 type:complete len:148 (-) Transcript_5346:466-909(-)